MKTAKKNKMAKVMEEFKKKKLKSSAGPKVKDKKQALAIAFSEAKKAAEGKYKK